MCRGILTRHTSVELHSLFSIGWLISLEWTELMELLGPNAEQSHTFSETVQTTSGSRKHKRSSDNLDGLAATIVAGIESYSGYIDKLADAMHGKDPTWVLGDELHRLGLTPNESVQIAMRLSGNAGLTKFKTMMTRRVNLSIPCWGD
ncbi:hypothetical protein Tsubulata_031616 [Turnera subulata]|uniref:Uncharacterized protein n=1 Tax=Turnera subulata TaxID=218843 RepID=A0A9Q0G091_9ROSI|nr:hypothetical protein Tsubulata_031616 [Turnera subulata]